MSRKHNTKHRRSTSNYPLRLAARGLGKSPIMKDYVGVEKVKATQQKKR